MTVSMELNFLSAVPEGSTIIVRGECLKSGRTLAFVQGSIEIEGKGTTCVRFSQVKALSGTPNVIRGFMGDEVEGLSAKL